MEQPEVTIEQGVLKGATAVDYKGNKFLKFKGIPYAKPPLGKLRFKAPEPPGKFETIFDATKEGNVCYSREPLKGGEIFGSENCLFLNVYTKKLPDDKDKSLKPVLFWVHGGGFFFGSGNEELYAPDFLITEDVVLVTINYRLGLLGFISFEDPSLGIPGNTGLKDQVMALKWVQKNISSFGGDPGNVTIFGESAGAASVHLLMLSPSTKGLFHKAVAQSGCALNPWVVGTRGAHLVAEAMGLEEANESLIYEILMEKSMEEIFQLQESMLSVRKANKRRPIGLVVEPKSDEAFLDDEPIEMILSQRFNQVPFIVGFTTAEGMIYELFNKKDDEILDYEDLIPLNFGYKSGTPEISEVVDKIKNFYFGDGKNDLTNKIDLLGDCHFIYGIYLTVMNQFKLSQAPTYLYRMSIETELNFFKNMLNIDASGVSHLDDVGYLFKNFATPTIKKGSIEELGMTRFVKLWTNFAKYGNPTPDVNDPILEVEWKPVTNKDCDFLDIGNKLVPMTNPNSERIAFWKQLQQESPQGKRSPVLP